ncbi:hypothetical protein GCM10008956_30310 [Deinococcus arenae]|uniref:Uncharacterized protein n=1 Tax=Deinococcus arenae TaxID=1452751 RepID=A0A8H9GSA9_9DEIO|nr:SNF2-related protein [Deinococcus arenae]GGM52156.1 hypothetical protein GCM10008956_30310 [Deinococcus arenae]
MTVGSTHTIGEYAVLRRLGQGGQGDVWQVQDPNIPNKKWALKLMADELLYRREGAILRKLAGARHPGIPFLGNAFDTVGQYALVMTCFEGDTLDILRTQQPGWRAVWSWIQALAEILTTVHAQGFLHLDLKPENILRTRDGQLRLIDFANGLPLGSPSHGHGTPGFAAPEQMRRQEPLEPATDIYGLGALAFFLLKGQAYSAGQSVQVSGVPDGMSAFIEKMLAEPVGARPTLQEIRAFDPAVAAAGLLRCPACQRENRRAARFCSHCGKRIQPTATIFTSASTLPRLLPPTHVEQQGAETQRVLSTLAQPGGDERRDLNLQRLRLLGEEIAQIKGFEQLVAPQRVRHLITSYSHQTQAVERALREMRGNAILADEVGLGKTIEAGLIIKELVLRKLVDRVLILVPHHLPDQWTEEMQEKLDLPFHAYTGPPDWGKRLLVASIAAFTHPANRTKIPRMKPYDLIVVDEMHNLLLPSGTPAPGWELLNTLPRKYLLLLSATPVRRHIKELFHLVSLVKPGHFESEQQFLLRFQASSSGLRVNHADELKNALQEVMIRNSRQTIDPALLPPPRRVEFEELIPNPVERQLLLETIQLAAQGHFPMSRSFLEDIFSSTHALIDVAASRAGHYSANLQPYLTGRQGVPDSKVERAMELIQSVADQVIVFTRHRATAQAMVKAARAAGLHVVEYKPGLSRQERAQRFYEFKRTPKAVLVTLEGAAEGRNLQFCQHLINLDIPWNPLRLEQRIGRIDRIGQRRIPMVYNFILVGSFEQEILRIYTDQLQMFALIVGELASILNEVAGLGNRTLDDEFARIFAAGRGDPGIYLPHMQQLGHRLRQARTNFDTDVEKKSAIDDLF